MMMNCAKLRSDELSFLKRNVKLQENKGYNDNEMIILDFIIHICLMKH